MKRKILFLALVAVFTPSLWAATYYNIKSGNFDIADPTVYGQTAFKVGSDAWYVKTAATPATPWIEINRTNCWDTLTTNHKFPGWGFYTAIETRYHGDSEETYSFSYNGGIRFYGHLAFRHCSTTPEDATIHFTGSMFTNISNYAIRLLTDKPAPYTTTLSVEMPIGSRYTTAKFLITTNETSKGTLRFRLGGKMNGYKGSIIAEGDVSNRVVVVSSANSQITTPIVVTGTSGIEQEGGSVYLSSVSMSNTTSFIMLSTNGTLAIKDFSANGGYIKYGSVGSGINMQNAGMLVITNGGTCLTTEPIHLCVNRQAVMFSGRTLGSHEGVVPLARYYGTDSSVLRLEDFVLDVDETVEPEFGTLAGNIKLGSDVVDGSTYIFATVSSTVVYKKELDDEDATKVPSEKPGSALSDGMGQYKWSDGLDQHAGAIYIVGYPILVCNDEVSSTFKGDSMTVLYDQKLTHLGRNANREFYAEKLALMGGSTLVCCNPDGTIGTDVFTGGPVTFKQHPDTSVCLYTPNGDVDVNFRSGIAGDAVLRVYNAETASGSGHAVSVRIDGSSSTFSGGIEIVPPPGFEDQSAGRPQFRTTLEVPSAQCLGGPCATLNPQSLLINGNQTLSITDTTTFDEPTRGLSFRSDEQGVPAYLNIADSRQAVIKQPLYMRGEICKTGGGTLAVGGDCQITFLDSPDGEPESGRNKLTVSDGALMALSTNAFDGCAITFREGTRLIIKADTEDDDLRCYGLCNMREPTAPIVLDGTEMIDVEFSAPSTYTLPDSNQRIALCTLPLDYNGVTVESFRLGALGERHGAVIVETNHDRGTRTFYADFEDAGMAVIVR